MFLYSLRRDDDDDVGGVGVGGEDVGDGCDDNSGCDGDDCHA